MVILDFFKNALNLKNISRQGWIDKLSIEHPESVADHSYSMAIMGMVISDLENYDSEKMLKMILLHDLAESKIGDYTPNQISKENKIKIENIYSVLDCGMYVNRDAVINQMEGAAIFGMSITMFGKISTKNGAVDQSNFHDYQMTRMIDAPNIHVHLVDNDEDPTGVGEPGVPPVSAAKSTMIVPGPIASTISCVISCGAFRPGTAAVVITT